MGVKLGLLLKKLLLEDHVIVVLGGRSVVEGLVLILLLGIADGVSLEVRNFVASVRRLVSKVVEGSDSVDVVMARGGLSSNSSRMWASSSMVDVF